MPEKFNPSERINIENEVKNLFKEQELVDEDGDETDRMREINAAKQSKPKPNLDYYDKKRDKNFPYEARFGIDSPDSKE